MANFCDQRLILRRFLCGLACIWLAGGGIKARGQSDAPKVKPQLIQMLNEPLGEPGEAPKGEDGKPLNFNFETGNLDGWKLEGKAFEGQPIQGEIDPKRPFGEGKRADFTGKYWLGGFEKLRDLPKGTLTSPTFTVTKPFASFLLGGGSHEETRVELVLAEGGKVFFSASGRNQENMTQVIVDLTPQLGKKIFLRIVDDHTGGWGHVNFDDFRLYPERPRFRTPPPPVIAAAGNAPAATALYPHAGLTAAEAAKAMQLPPGFSVQVGAAEPDVVQPVAMALDDRGRVWVAEALSYPNRQPAGQGKDRILVFEDTDQNGSLDKRTVFIDKLNLISGLEVGFGGVWVGAAPELLFIPDRNRDDQPDGPPEVLLDGWGYEDTHETLNSFIWGPDGWLYGCHGVFTNSKVGKPGAPENERTPLNAGIWRFHPLRKTFEVFAHGTSNPWGVDFNDVGEAFCTACVIPHLFHIIPGARYQRQAGQHFNRHTYDDIKTIAQHRHYTGNQWNDENRRQSDELGGGHAHAGAMIYQGVSWPEKYRNQIFMNNIHGNRMNVDLLSPRGSGYVGNFAPDFLFTRDQWSQMLYMTYAPDGQVWVIDWYDRNQCHRREEGVHDRSNGRIYRIAYNGAKPVKVDLQSWTEAQLIGALASTNQWYVRHARRLLQERSAKEPLKPQHRELLAEAVFTTKGATALEALWTLHVIGGVTPAEAEKYLAHPSPEVRGWTIRLAAEQPSSPLGAFVIKQLPKLAEDDSPIVRLAIASALQRLPPAQRWEPLAKLLTRNEDARDHNLPLLYWYALEPLADVEPAGALAMGLSAGETIPLVRDFVIRKIGAGDPEQALALLVSGLSKADQPTAQLTFLRGMQDGLKGRKNLTAPPEWNELLPVLRKSSDAAVRRESLALAVALGDASAVQEFRSLLASSQAAAEERSFALATLLRAGDRDLPPILHNLLGDAALRSPAIRGLAMFDHPATPEKLLPLYSQLSPGERRDLLATLGSRPAYALALLSSVEKRQIPASDLTADLVVQLRNLGSEELTAAITRVWGSVRETAADRLQLITHYKSLLNSPPQLASDLQLGRAVFAKTCQQCHSLFATGGKIGPDLTGSNRANLDYLLSNVIDPSAVMAKDYQPTILLLASGRVVTGLIKEETPAALVVQTAQELLTIAKADIEEQQQSPKSMMPDDLLRPLSQHEVRSLVAYLASPGQTPQLATRESAAELKFAPGLPGWRGDSALWSVENGELVGKTAGLKKNEFLVSELSLGDFRLSVEVKLIGNQGNSGVQFRSEPLAGGEVKGYQADIGPGWWGKLYEEHGRALLWKESGEAHVKLGEWNRYEIVAVGSRVQTWLNGQRCVDLNDPAGARRGVLAFQLHSGGATEVRYRNLQITLPPSHMPSGESPLSQPAAPGEQVKFRKTTLDRRFRSEGVAMGDFNNDGLLDIAAGSVWYAAPDWKMHAVLDQPKEFDIRTYSDTFCNWAEDLNGDGWQDLIVVDFPGKPTWWFENPHTPDKPWPRHQVTPVTNNESPQYADVDSDGRRELIFGEGKGRLALARPAAQPQVDWKITLVGREGEPNIQKFFHGLGVGDVNRDGQRDLFVPSGWWNAAPAKSNEPWSYAAAPLGEAQAQMYAYDFDGDGDNDLVGTSAHRRGIWWYEQTPSGFVTHKIDESIAQTHALILADINGDGLADLVTGKRFYAHNGRDPGEDEPPELAWYELARKEGKPAWTKRLIDNDSGVGTQFEVHDLNGDGLLDIVIANKRGVFYFEQGR